MRKEAGGRRREEGKENKGTEKGWKKHMCAGKGENAKRIGAMEE